MSNLVLTRVWQQSKQIKNHRLLLVALADGVNDFGVGFHGTRYLSEKILLSEKQTKRLRNDLENRGEIYLRPGNGRGVETLYLVCTALSQEEIKSALESHFEMSSEDAQNVTLSIVEKRGTFLKSLTERGTNSIQKGDKNHEKGDMVERKSRTTINHNNPYIRATKKPSQIRKPKEPKVAKEKQPRTPQRTDPLFDAIGKHIFDATTPAAVEACNWRIGQILYGDKKRLQTGLIAFEAARQAKLSTDLDYVKLASDVDVFMRNFKKNHPDMDLKDCVKVMEWWVKFRAAQDKTAQAVEDGKPWFDENESIWKRRINGQLQHRDPNTGDWTVAA